MFSLSRYGRFVAALVVTSEIGLGWIPAAQGEDRVITIGGVRDVVVTISDSAENYGIVVDMLAVRAFDSATNKRLNLQKARAFAMQALAKHLGLMNSVRFTVQGMEVWDSTTKSKRYRLTLLLPHRGVAAVGMERAKPASPKGNASETAATSAATKTEEAKVRLGSRQRAWHGAEEESAMALLTRAADYLDTLARLREGTLEDLAATQQKRLAQDDFYSAMGDLEEQVDRLSKLLEAEIQADKLLLSMEREELFQAIRRERDATLKELRAAVEQFDARQVEAKEKANR